MKLRITFHVLLLLVVNNLLSQVPQGFNYQAIARDGSGNPITGATIKVKLSILSDTLGFKASGAGVYVWEEEHTNVKTNAFGLFTVVLGTGTQVGGSALSFSSINWNGAQLFIGTKIANPTTYKIMGSARLWSVPYAMSAGTLSGPLTKLAVNGSTPLYDEALFEVKNNYGQTIFAVYNEGVRIYVDNGAAKAGRGGFAVGGFDRTKAVSDTYFIVSPDSIRAYIGPTSAKPSRGGFAVGGFDRTKAITEEYLRVTRDSTRVYINDLPGKPSRGGFAVGGFDKTKGSGSEYFGINPSSTPEIINPAQPRILWYPLREAFLTGRVLIESPDSIGTNSIASGFESKAVGDYSQALGYKAVARGDYSTSIGKNSLSKGANSFAFGNLAKATADDAYSLGAGAIASAPGSFAIGSAGVDSTGRSVGNTVASGFQSFALGFGSVSSGYGSFSYGLENQATGPYSMSLGYQTNSIGWFATSMGYNTTSSGIYSTAMGNFTESSGAGSISLGCFTSSEGLSTTTLGWGTLVEPGSDQSNYNMGAMASGVSTKAGHFAATSFGDRSYASGHTSFATGYSTTAAGHLSATFGAGTTANGYGSIATGHGTVSNGIVSTATGYGTVSNGFGSIATGNGTVADGDGSLSIGLQTVARSFASLVLGQYNVVSGTPNLWVGSEPALVIGNGSSDQNRSNAMTVNKNGSAILAGPIYLNDNATFGAVYVNNNQAIWHDGNYFSWGYDGNYNVFADRVSVGTTVNPGTYALYVAGNIGVTGTVTNPSDARYKINVDEIDNVLDKVEKIRSITYNWNTDKYPEMKLDDSRQLGFIAQEVEPWFPELVKTDLEGYKSLDYSRMSVILLQAVKEQNLIIKSQQKQMHEWSSELDQLKAELNEIKALLSSAREN